MAYERIDHQVIKSVEEEWKEFRAAVMDCATECVVVDGWGKG